MSPLDERHGVKVRLGQGELVISRGRTGYLALYRFLPHVDRILVLALRHQRESGYKGMSLGTEL